MAAAIGIYLAALEISENVSEEDVFEKLSEAKNISSGGETYGGQSEMGAGPDVRFRSEQKGLGQEVIAAQMKGEALAIRDEDIEVCRKIGEHGLRLLKRGQGF